jgi:hypothetical protein
MKIRFAIIAACAAALMLAPAYSARADGLKGVKNGGGLPILGGSAGSGTSIDQCGVTCRKAGHKPLEYMHTTSDRGGGVATGSGKTTGGAKIDGGAGGSGGLLWGNGGNGKK